MIFKLSHTNRIDNMMRQFSLVAIVMALVLSVSYSANVTGSSGSGNSISGSATTVYPSTTVNASNTIITIASNAVVQAVGKAYFNSYISLQSAQTTYQNGANTSIVSYNYEIPYANGSTTSGYGQAGGLVYKLDIVVYMNNYNVVQYRGPAAPYYVAIGPASAELDAYNYGLSNITRLYVTAAYTNKSLLSGPYRLTWAALSGNLVKVGNCSTGCSVHPGVYVNTSTGAIDGQFSINPSIEAATGPSYALLGNFSTYNVQPSQQQTANTSAILLDSVGVRLAAIGIVLLVVIFIIVRKRKRMKRKR